MPKIALYGLKQNTDSLTETPSYITRRQAAEYIRRGWVKVIGKRKMQKVIDFKPFRFNGEPIRGCQGKVYEKAAIETVIIPRAVGGMVRTETQPRNIPFFTGARVGHQ